MFLRGIDTFFCFFGNRYKIIVKDIRNFYLVCDGGTNGR